MRKKHERTLDFSMLKDLHAKQNYLQLYEHLKKCKTNDYVLDGLGLDLMYDLGLALSYGYFGLERDMTKASRIFNAIISKASLRLKEAENNDSTTLSLLAYLSKSKFQLRRYYTVEYERYMLEGSAEKGFEYANNIVGLMRSLAKDTQLPYMHALLAEILAVVAYDPRLTSKRKLELMKEELEANLTAIAGNDPVAMYNYAIDLKNGSPVIKQDIDKAMEYFYRSAHQYGYHASLNELGLLYILRGPEFYDQAEACFLQSARAGIAQGYANLANYLHGKAIGGDGIKLCCTQIKQVSGAFLEASFTEDARYYSELAAEGGSVIACSNLGIRYLQGSFGYPKDPLQSLYWFVFAYLHETPQMNYGDSIGQYIEQIKPMIKNKKVRTIVDRVIQRRRQSFEKKNSASELKATALLEQYFCDRVKIQQPNLDEAFEREFSHYRSLNDRIMETEQTESQLSDIIEFICEITHNNKVSVVNYCTAIHRIGVALSGSQSSLQSLLCNHPAIIRILDGMIEHLKSVRGVQDGLNWRSLCSVLHGLSAMQLHAEFPRYHALMDILIEAIPSHLPDDVNEQLSLLHSLARMQLSVQQAKNIYQWVGELKPDQISFGALSDGIYSLAILHCSHPSKAPALTDSVQRLLNYFSSHTHIKWQDNFHRAVLLAMNYWRKVGLTMPKEVEALALKPLPNCLYTISKFQRDVTFLLSAFKNPIIIEYEKDGLSYDIYFPEENIALQVLGPHHFSFDKDKRKQPTPRHRFLKELSNITVVELPYFDWDSIPQKDRVNYLERLLKGHVTLQQRQRGWESLATTVDDRAHGVGSELKF